MANLWRKLAYSHINKKVLYEIHRDMAKEALIEWIDDKLYLWRDGGWSSIGTVISDFARTMEVYANIAKESGGPEEYYRIAREVALEELYYVNLKDGGK